MYFGNYFKFSIKCTQKSIFQYLVYVTTLKLRSQTEYRFQSPLHWFPSLYLIALNTFNPPFILFQMFVPVELMGTDVEELTKFGAARFEP
jgi:hypothetical protein